MKSGSLVSVVWAVGFLLPAAVAAMPGEASACGMAVHLAPGLESPKQRKTPAVMPKPVLVASAEEALSEGKVAKAATTAVNVFPALKTIKAGTLPLADRALRILAVAAVRANGGLTVGGLAGNTPAERTATLEWAIGTLRDLNAQRINNPSYQTDLGEALSKVPAHQEEALKMLGELSEKDLLTSAEGYAALARLQAEKGDAPAREAAVKRCETMTKDPKVCDVPDAADPGSST
jgi:hypothetical protein